MALPHGYSKYTNEKCRCDVCKAAWAKYYREYRKGLRRRTKDGHSDDALLNLDPVNFPETDDIQPAEERYGSS
jgi:hypothetical protein